METLGSALFGLVMLIGLIILYFLPALVASRRKHRQTDAIFVLNLLGGWTGVIWLGALVWAMTTEAPR